MLEEIFLVTLRKPGEGVVIVILVKFLLNLRTTFALKIVYLEAYECNSIIIMFLRLINGPGVVVAIAMTDLAPTLCLLKR